MPKYEAKTEPDSDSQYYQPKKWNLPKTKKLKPDV